MPSQTMFRTRTLLLVLCAALMMVAPGASSSCDEPAPEEPELPEGPPCEKSADCGASEFCQKNRGDCTGEGVCAALPGNCNAYAPQCGCDGFTYGSVCAADHYGVIIDHSGECAGKSFEDTAI